MNLLKLQIQTTRHISLPVKMAMADNNPVNYMNRAALLFYAAHRLLRLACGCCYGFESVSARSGEFKALVSALTNPEERCEGPFKELHAILATEDIKLALETLVTEATAFLDPEKIIRRGEEDWFISADAVEQILTTLLPLATALQLASSDNRGNIYVPAGPAGCATINIPGTPSFRTVCLLPDNSIADCGPALHDRDVACESQTIIPWPGIESAFETAEGLVIDDSGTLMAPVGRLTASTATGRLLAWHNQNTWDTANRLLNAKLKSSAAEYLLVRTTDDSQWQSPAFVQKLHDFMADNQIIDALDPFHTYAVRILEEIESRHKADSNFGAVADVMIVRQQFQQGHDRALTLTGLANIYSERLADNAAAQLCLVKAIEATPDNPDILAELMELVREGNAGESHAGPTSLELAREFIRIAKGSGRKGKDIEDLARKAVTLASTADDPDTFEDAIKTCIACSTDRSVELEMTGMLAELLSHSEDRTEELAAAHARILELYPDDIISLDYIISRIDSPEEIINECATRLKSAWKPDSRAQILRYQADALIKIGDMTAATLALTNASTLLPESTEILDLLCKVLKESQDWPSLTGIMKRRADLDGNPVFAKSMILEITDIALEKMDSPATALGYLNQIADASGLDVLRRLYLVHSKMGMWIQAAQDLKLITDQTADDEELRTLAGIYRNKLGQTGEAAKILKGMLNSLDGAALAAAALDLAATMEESGETADLPEILTKALNATTDQTTKTAILKRLGNLHSDDETGSAATAMRYFEESLRLNPTDADCALKLATIYLSKNMAEKAVPLFEAPARKAASDGLADVECRLRLLAAEACERCSDMGGAATQLSRILAINPDNLAAVRRLASIEYSLGNYDRTISLLESVFPENHHFVESDAPLLRELGRALTGRNDPTNGLERLKQAWQLDGDKSEPVLRELADTAVAAGELGAAVNYLHTLILNETPGPRRFADLIMLGDTVRTNGAPAQALEWYLMASKEGCSRKVALHKALEAAVEANDFAGARGLLMDILQDEQDGLKKSDYYVASAMLARNNLNDDELAISHLKMALEHNPDNSQAAEPLQEYLTGLNRFEELADMLSLRARHYRMESDDKNLVEVLKQLADVFESGLHNNRKAAEIFKQILTCAPQDSATRKRLADSLARIPGAEKEALDTFRQVVATDPTSIESFRSLRDLAILTSDQNLSTIASSALLVLGQGDDSDFNMVSQHRTAALKLKRDRLPPDAFTGLIATTVEIPVARIFALIHQPILNLVPFHNPSESGLKAADRIDMTQTGLLQTMAVAVSRFFSLDLPVFWHVRGSSGIKKAPFAEKSVLVGDDVLTSWRGKDLRYALARAIVSFAPGYELAGILDAASMRMFFLAALKMSYPDYPLPADATGAGEFVPALSRMLKEPQLAEIREILGTFRKQQRPVDLPGYMRAVDMAAARAGLFMASDLEVAAARTMDGDLVLSDMEPEDRLVELCAWAVSNENAELRSLMLQD